MEILGRILDELSRGQARPTDGRTDGRTDGQTDRRQSQRQYPFGKLPRGKNRK